MTERRLWDAKASASEHITRHLHAICGALRLESDLPKFEEVVGALVGGWGRYPVRELPISYILSLDGSPAEFSVVSSRAGAKLRFAVQSFVDESSEREIVRFRKSLDELGRLTPLDPSLFDRLAPLLDRGAPHFGIQCELRPGGLVPCKAYSTAENFEVFAALLDELGPPDAAARLRDLFDERYDICRGVALPLGGPPHVQFYFNHKAETLDRLKRIVALGDGVNWRDLEFFVSSVLNKPVDGLGATLLTAMTKIYVPAEAGARMRIAVDCPMRRFLFFDGDSPVSDAEFERRMLRVFDAWNIPPDAYRASIRAFARAPLDHEFMIQEAFSYQEREPGERSIAIYLSPRIIAYQSDRFQLGWDAPAKS